MQLLIIRWRERVIEEEKTNIIRRARTKYKGKGQSLSRNRSVLSKMF